ncbi:MAG: hypothetical protein HYX40_06015 [Sphingobacteriales bacterium]|nr:hypothetical protein [Sphingobacteriales bacterium]
MKSEYLAHWHTNILFGPLHCCAGKSETENIVIMKASEFFNNSFFILVGFNGDKNI